MSQTLTKSIVLENSGLIHGQFQKMFIDGYRKTALLKDKLLNTHLERGIKYLRR